MPRRRCSGSVEHFSKGIEIMASIADRAVLVTGANRGIGRALVEEALRRGAKRVYAGMRAPLEHPDERVTPLILDVTDRAQIHSAADQVESLDVLINNAGLALYDDLSDRSRSSSISPSTSSALTA
jgi:NAD(P)-dependent dehydrogenase (short-subunit alcohol dehydrogenase family)